MIDEDTGARKPKARMATETAYGKTMDNKEIKTNPREELIHKQLQPEKRNEQTTARINSPKTSNRNMPTMNQTH